MYQRRGNREIGHNVDDNFPRASAAALQNGNLPGHEVTQEKKFSLKQEDMKM